MNLSKLFLFITIIYFLAFFAHGLLLGKTVYGDGVYYYSWLRSVAIDHDVNFTNEYAYFDVAQPMRPTGIPGNKYSIGPAIFWAPAFIATHHVAHGSGYELPYHLAVGFTNVSLALVGLLLLYNLLRKFFSENAALTAIAGITLATNLFFYGAIDPVNTHALTFFAATAYLTLLFEKEKRWSLIGIALGLMGLIRPQDLVYGILVIPLYVKVQPLQRLNLPAIQLLLGFFLTMLPQFFAWNSLYGSFITNPYAIEGQSFNFFSPKILEVLFSPNNGLFLWTPILLPALIGIFLNLKSKILNRNLMFLVVLLQFYLVASWQFWWQGASYSGRMFVSILPLFAFGLASVAKIHPNVKYVVPLAALLNVGLIVFFLKST